MISKMPNRVIFSSTAESELNEAYNWYENKQPQLGERFLDIIEESISKIDNQPESYPVKHNPYREFTVSIFPYVIIYEFIRAEKLLYILQVFHTSRNPGNKKMSNK